MIPHRIIAITATTRVRHFRPSIGTGTGYRFKFERVALWRGYRFLGNGGAFANARKDMRP